MDKKAVVIGGGRVAERKVLSLLKAGASVRVISPSITARLEKLNKKGSLTFIRRNYKKGDLKGAFIVFACTSSAITNSKIAGEADHLVNVIDTPAEGNFIVPSNVRRGPLTIAISTEGVSPAMSRAIRSELEDLYGPEFAGYLKFIHTMRSKALREIKDKRKRERFLKSLASEEILDSLRNSGFAELSKNISESYNKTK